jgi:hypothetical protein
MLTPENPSVCTDMRAEQETRVLLAMQKVEGSNPFSRLAKGLHLQAFFVCTVGWCRCVAGHPLGTRRKSRGGSVSEQARLQAFSDESNH